MSSLNIRQVSAAIISSLVLFLVGCGGGNNPNAAQIDNNQTDVESLTSAGQVVNSNEQAPAPVEISVGEAQAENSGITTGDPEPASQEESPEDPTTANNAPTTIPGLIKVPSVTLQQIVDHPHEPKFIVVHEPFNRQVYDDVNYAWFKNGEQISITSQPIFDKKKVGGDKIAVALRVTSEGETFSSVSPEIVVTNASPRIWWAEILPENPTNRDNLTISADVTDPDGDELEFSYSWEGYESTSDTLVGTNIYPENPLIVAYVTVSDGIAETTYRVTKELEVHEEFYSGLSEVDLVFGQPVSFKAGYRDDYNGDLETTMVSGPFGMTYENGWISWTPSSPTMFYESETYYAHFESGSGQRDTIELVVSNTDALDLTWNSQPDSILDDNEVPVADCEVRTQNADGSKVFCVASEYWVSCGRYGCNVSGETELKLYGSDLSELEVIPLWSSYYSVIDDEYNFYQAGNTLPVESPNSMSYLNSRDEILFLDHENRLSLFSASTGYITWYSEGPSNIEETIKVIDCPVSATNASQCSYVTYDGFRYSVN